MPIFVSCYGLMVNVTLSHEDDETVFHFSQHEVGPLGPSGEDCAETGLDAYLIRDVFLSIETELEALMFLRVTGPFLVPGSQQRVQGWGHFLRWSEFKEWQEVVRHVQVNGFRLDAVAETLSIPPLPHLVNKWYEDSPEDTRAWLDGIPFVTPVREKLRNGSSRLELDIIAYTAIEAILATAYIDRMSGVEYKLCALEGCGRVFSMEGRRVDAEYCSTQHAHHASVRRKRRQHREAKFMKSSEETKDGN